jgi:hypothetical protein
MFERIKYRIQYRMLAYRGQGEKKARKYADSAKKMIDKTVEGVGEEARETEEMAQAFFRMLEHKLKLNDRTVPPTEEEVREAIEQLKDVGRFSIFATISIIPGGGFSLIGLELLARKFGIKNFTIVPSSFRKMMYKEDKQKDQAPGETDSPV